MPDHLLNRSCPLCEQNKAKRLFGKGSLQLVQCEGCSMIYADPIEPRFASGQFYDQRGISFYLSRNKLESDHAAVRFERELRIFRAYCPSGSVLDVGCSTGAFLLSLKSTSPADYSVFGTDVVSAALDYAESHGVRILRKSFLDLADENLLFDAITFWAVMEHLVEPRKFLRQAASLLKPGGLCFVLVPNMNSLAVRVLGAKYRYIMPEHLNYFTPSTLRKFVEGCPEFVVANLTSTHFNPIVILKDLRGGTGLVPDSERAELLKRTTGWKQNPWLRPVKSLYSMAESALAAYNLADNLVIVLRKKVR